MDDMAVGQHKAIGREDESRTLTSPFPVAPASVSSSLPRWSTRNFHTNDRRRDGFCCVNYRPRIGIKQSCIRGLRCLVSRAIVLRLCRNQMERSNHRLNPPSNLSYAARPIARAAKNRHTSVNPANAPASSSTVVAEPTPSSVKRRMSTCHVIGFNIATPRNQGGSCSSG